MKRAVAALIVQVALIACAKEVPPTAENINKIYDSRDFTIEFRFGESQKETMSFVEDVIVYKRNDSIWRKLIDYDQASAINDFIIDHRNAPRASPMPPFIIIKNTALRTRLATDDYTSDYDSLLQKLKLP